MSHTLEPGRSARTTRLRRWGALAAVGVLSATGLSLNTGTADAALSSVGPADATTNFPTFYKDKNGMSLQLCFDPAAAICLTTEAELLGAGADGEGFYYDATTAAGGIDISLDLEAAFADVGAGQEVVFQRSQYSANGGGLRPNATYRIKDPYGTARCTSDAAGSIKNNACRIETAPVAGNFASALGGRIGPFLAWDTLGTAAGPPAGFIGDNATPHKVVGSPTGFNAVQVSGPGIVGTCPDGTRNCDFNNLFTVAGQLAPGAQGFVRSAVNFGDVTNTRVRTQHVTYRSIGDAAISVTRASVPAGGAFSLLNNSCVNRTLANGASCGFDVRYRPTIGRASAAKVSIVDATGTKTINLSGRGVDRTRPSVLVKSPAPFASAVSRSSNVVTRFSEPVKGVQRATFRLTNNSNGRTVSASITRGVRNRWILNPRASLAPNTRYTAHLVGGARAIRDSANNTLRTQTWTFRTR